MKRGAGSRYASVLPVLRYFYGLAWGADKAYFAIVAADMVIRGLAPFVNIVIPRYLIDELMGGRSAAVVAELVGALVLGNLAMGVASNGLGYLASQRTTRLEMRFEEMLGHQAMEMDFEHTENPEVLTQLEKARTGMSWYSGGIEGLTANLTTIVSGLLTFAGTVCIIGRLSPLLIAGLAAMTLLNMAVVSGAQQMQAQFMKDLVGLNRRFYYYFGLVKDLRYGKDIRMYAADGMVAKRLDRFIREGLSVELTKTELSLRYELASTLITVTQQATLYCYLGLRVLAGALSIGGFQMLLGSAQAFTASVSGVLRACIELAKNADFMNEYRVFMAYPRAKQLGTKEVAARSQHTFEFRGVSFTYPQAASPSLTRVSLTISAGERLCIVGENGAGKTTFIKLLCRLYDPTEGQILLDGVDIREYDIRDYMQTLAVVFQDSKLLAFTIGENVAASEHVDKARCEAAIEKAGLSAKLRTLERGMNTSVYRTFDGKGVDFSGGEAQKLTIARAAYKDAPVAVLDEPTAALDPLAEFEVYGHFDRLLGDKAALYISHRLSSCKFCDRVAVFHRGELVEYGTHADLVRLGGKYGEMWRAQAQHYEYEGSHEGRHEGTVAAAG